MFIKTIKLTKKSAVLTIIAVALILIAITLLAGRDSRREADVSRLKLNSSIKTNEDRIAFLEELGWIVEEEPIDEQLILIPRKFSPIYMEYNELQKQQGYDLSQYSGLEVTLYTYRVTNYPNTNDEVLANIYIRNNQVVGGDIHSTSLSGFMHGLK